IATILRYESYGMKHLIGKLIAAALLVNFSLVIGGSILNFADQMSSVFLTALPGGGGGIAQFHNFAKSFGGAFSPQRSLMNPTLSQADMSTSAEDLQKLQGAGSVGQSLGSLFTPLINLVFVAAILIVMCITIATFFFMLLIRYIYLGILFILMPFAWLFWVFPLTASIWKQWWDKFLKWTFFAPISLFFLWLVIITSQKMNEGAGTNPLQGLRGLGYTASDDTFLRGLSSFVGSFANQVIGTFLQASILVGLSLGGLIAAEKFSITGAKAVMGAAKAVGKFGQAYVGKRAKQAGGALAQRMGAQNLANRLQGTNIAANRGRLARFFAAPLNFAATHMGAGIQAATTAGRKGLVHDAEARVKKQAENLSGQERANLLSSLTGPERIAMLKLMKKENQLRHVDAQRWFGPERQAEFERLGEGLEFEELNKASGGLGEIFRDTQNGQAGLEEIGGRVDRAVEAEAVRNPALTQEQLELFRQRTIANELATRTDITQAIRESIRSIKPGDKVQIADLFREGGAFGLSQSASGVLATANAAAIARLNPAVVPGMVRGMDAERLEHFSQVYRPMLDEGIRNTAPESDEHAQLVRAKRGFERILINRSVDAPGTTPGPAPAPPPGTP
ncbi:MAG: hypothetical protein V1885_03255, partial [Candidatus Brennerbacteria bacterium]